MPEVINIPCKRCKEPSVLVSRTEPFCKKCFVRFVQHKQKKKMEDYKVNYNEGAVIENVLLPLSFGPSSIALLDMVVEMLRYQITTHNGKQGLYLHVVHIDETGVHGNGLDIEKALEEVKRKYPECTSITSIKLETFLEAPDVTKEIIDIGSSNTSTTPKNTKELLAMLIKRTSQHDILKIIREKIIEKARIDLNCSTILWGHSMTRLAELVVSMTAKGRGDIIPDVIFNEKENPRTIYPLIDILSSEISDYNKVQEIEDIVLNTSSRRPATTKLQSIDELVNQYFVSVEKGFPSVVSTVVRTAAKLAPGEVVNESRGLKVGICKICGAPAKPDSLEWLEKITVNTPAPSEDEVVRDDKENTKEGAPELCYGCITVFKDSMISQMSWPKRANKEEIINEYSLE